MIVMYGGKIQEVAPVKELFKNPLHPYTRGLLASLPTWMAIGNGGSPRFPATCPAFSICRRVQIRDTLQRTIREMRLDRAATHRVFAGTLGALPSGESMKILEVENLRVRFPVVGGVFARKIGEVKAVDGVSLALEQGETLGLVGESGCGKSTVGRAIINILRAMVYGVEISGSIKYHHASGTVDLAQLSRGKMRPYRPDLQMIFQDPYSSLNPRMTVEQIVEEPLKIYTRSTPKERRDRIGWLLGKVGFDARASESIPSRIFRRPAPAHRDRARSGNQPQDCHRG